MPAKRKALIVTYTLANPYAVGVFFRALRLARELNERGWAVTVWNFGPLVDDPKLRDLPQGIEVRNDIDASDPGKAHRQLRSVRADLVIFGEAPFYGAMHTLWKAAVMLGRPFALMEQYYDLGTPGKFDCDVMLLYGLKCFWKKHRDNERRWIMVSPFIETGCQPADLVAPPPPRGAMRVTILGFDRMVLEEGIRLAASLHPRPQVVTLSSDPAAAARLATEAGIPASHAVALPLQRDAALYALLESSAAAIVANGFMQIMESIAMGCPAICIDRGIGMWSVQLDASFDSVACFASSPGAREKLEGWLGKSPFDAELLAKLRAERNGATECASHLEALHAHPEWLRIRARQAKYVTRHLAQSALRWARPAAAARSNAAGEGTPA
jgi:hypothetical protein